MADALVMGAHWLAWLTKAVDEGITPWSSRLRIRSSSRRMRWTTSSGEELGIFAMTGRLTAGCCFELIVA